MKLTTTTILALLFAPLVQAAVSVSPVHLNVVQNARTTSVQFINDTDQASVIDVQVKKWLGQNADGSDILKDTDAIILSRPVVNVAARASATIRLVVKERSGAAEDSYRVLVSDITPPAKDGKVAVRMNSILPLFVMSNTPSQGRLETDAVILSRPVVIVAVRPSATLRMVTPPAKDGKVAVRMQGRLELQNVLKNTGNRHVRISGYTDANGRRVDQLRYVFPGQFISLPVKSVDDVVYSDDIY